MKLAPFATRRCGDAEPSCPFYRLDGYAKLTTVNAFFKAATEKGTVVTSIKVALIVGTILGLINYGDRIFLRHDMRLMDWAKLALTYFVPFCVATYGAARFAAKRHLTR